MPAACRTRLPGAERAPSAPRSGGGVGIGRAAAAGVLLLSGAVALAGCRRASGPDARDGPPPAPSADGKDLGATPAVVTLDGQPLNPLAPRSSGWTVLVFMRTTCPVANRYAPEINRLYDEYASRGVRFFRVYVDPDETPEAVEAHTREYAHRTPALRDPQHWLVRRLEARVTPEVVLLDSQGEVLYQGRIDDRYVDFGKTRVEARRRDLRLAIEAALAGEAIEVRRTQAVGCFIADVGP